MSKTILVVVLLFISIYIYICNYRLQILEKDASQVDGLKEAVRARLARCLKLLSRKTKINPATEILPYQETASKDRWQQA